MGATAPDKRGKPPARHLFAGAGPDPARDRPRQRAGPGRRDGEKQGEWTPRSSRYATRYAGCAIDRLPWPRRTDAAKNARAAIRERRRSRPSRRSACAPLAHKLRRSGPAPRPVHAGPPRFAP